MFIYINANVQTKNQAVNGSWQPPGQRRTHIIVTFFY